MAEIPVNKDFNTLQGVVAEQLAELGPAVMAEVASRMAERETKKRADKMVQALDKIAELIVAHQKLGPDNVAYDEKGAKISENYTKKRVDEINKSKSTIEKLQNAVAKAHSSGDYSELDKLLGGGQKSQGEGGTKDSGEPSSGSGGKDS